MNLTDQEQEKWGIWSRTMTLDWVNQSLKQLPFPHDQIGLDHYLGIQLEAIDEHSLSASMMVTHNHKQPFGLLHGGASCVLAESLGSIASNLIIDDPRFMSVGVNLNAQHLRPVFSGRLHAEAKIIHKGKTTHLWDIHIWEEDKGKEKPCCVVRFSTQIVPRTKT